MKSLKIPQAMPKPSDITLSNGIRLIVRTEKASPTVTLIGSIKHEADLQTPAGKEGVGEVLSELFSYGTASRDRLKFQEALDDIAASESGGVEFSLKALKQYFPKGVELLADNQLHPALLTPDAFQIVRDQTAQFTDGNLKSPGYRTQRALDLGLLPKRRSIEDRCARLRRRVFHGIDVGRRQDLLRQAIFRPDMTPTIGRLSAISRPRRRAR